MIFYKIMNFNLLNLYERFPKSFIFFAMSVYSSLTIYAAVKGAMLAKENFSWRDSSVMENKESKIITNLSIGSVGLLVSITTFTAHLLSIQKKYTFIFNCVTAIGLIIARYPIEVDFLNEAQESKRYRDFSNSHMIINENELHEVLGNMILKIMLDSVTNFNALDDKKRTPDLLCKKIQENLKSGDIDNFKKNRLSTLYINLNIKCFTLESKYDFSLLNCEVRAVKSKSTTEECNKFKADLNCFVNMNIMQNRDIYTPKFRL